MTMQSLTLDQVQRAAPSAFAMQPWGLVSKNYQYISTREVISSLMDNGMVPVKALQSRTRIPGKADFTRHQIRFSMMTGKYQVGELVPQVLLTNSHDRTSAFQLDMGLFRLVCLNGLAVGNGDNTHISIRHSGNVGNVIDGAFELVDEFPALMGQVEQWRGIELDVPRQLAFAEAAKEFMPTTIDTPAYSLIQPIREADRANDLFTVMNRIQEKVVKGGISGRTESNKRRRTKAITSIDSDMKFNKALWKLTAEMAKLAA